MTSAALSPILPGLASVVRPTRTWHDAACELLSLMFRQLDGLEPRVIGSQNRLRQLLCVVLTPATGTRRKVSTPQRYCGPRAQAGARYLRAGARYLRQSML
jgi:hypothetical protein